MTRGARTCRQQDDGLNISSAPRQDEKPSADSERAQRWRLRLASFLFAGVLLADRLWLCAAAERTSTEGERRNAVPFRDTGDQEYRSSHGTTDYTHHFAGNSSTPLWRLEACHPDSVSKSCFTVANAEAACSGLSDAEWNLSDLYLSFCDSYSLLDLFYGLSSPDNVSCGHNMSACSRCVRAFQRLDRLAQDRYHEFELLVQKYETDAYSVRTCMDECTVGIAHLKAATRFAYVFTRKLAGIFHCCLVWGFSLLFTVGFRGLTHVQSAYITVFLCSVHCAVCVVLRARGRVPLLCAHLWIIA